MPLDPVALSLSILSLTDSSRGDFKGFPLTNPKTAENWAEVAFSYFSALTNPVPNPAALGAGRDAFVPAMTAGLGTPAGGFTALGSGFAAFAGALAVGVAPYVATPPPAPLIITPGPLTAFAVPAAIDLAAQIDTWARTGTASIPPAPPVPWA